MLASVTGSITSAIGNHGVYAIFGLMLIDAVFPAASELVMVYAGALAAGAFTGQHVDLFSSRLHSGFPAFLGVVAAGTIGYTIGSIIGWGIGAYGGRPLLDQRGQWFHLGPKQVNRAERWFDRYGQAAAFVGRVTPLARSFISIPAGVFRLPLGRYTVLTFLGSTLWCLGFAGIGWAVGSHWHRFHESFRFVDYAVVVLVVAAAAAIVLRRRSRGRDRPAAPLL